jgi:integrase
VKEKLTKAYVDRQQPSGKRVEIWDTLVQGLFVRVEPSGRKAYMVYARAKDGRQIRKALGDHGQISVETARVEAQKVIAEVKFGNPDKVTGLGHGTLRSLIDAYLTEHLEPVAKRTDRDASLKNAKVALLTSGRLDGFLDRLVETITLDQIESHYKTLCSKSVATANTTMDCLRAAWNWGSPRLCPRANPAQFKRRPIGKRERFLEITELQAFYKALVAYRASADPIDQSRADAVELMLITGCRVGGAASLELANIKPADGVVILMEKGSKGRGPKARRVPLTKRVGELLASRPVADPRWAFPAVGVGRQGDNVGEQSLQRLVRALARTAGITTDDITPHVLRHTWSTLAQAAPKQGLTLQEVSKVIGHADARMTARYTHANPIEAMNAQAIETFILDIATAGQVVPFPGVLERVG